MWIDLHQCCHSSRNIAHVTLEIIYFYYRKMYLQNQSIQKLISFHFEKNTTNQHHPYFTLFYSNVVDSHECHVLHARCVW